MRCRCCDKRLSEFESTRKSINTGEYLDMCNSCYNTISNQVLSYERYDLYDEQDDEGSSEPLDMDYGLDINNRSRVDNDL
jgi:hypothetical protein